MQKKTAKEKVKFKTDNQTGMLFKKLKRPLFSRRSFLKISIFSAAMYGIMSACKRKNNLASLLFFADSLKEEPGKTSRYTSVCDQCHANCPVIVKTFENRPIKIEGNPESFSGGGLCPLAHASLVNLYHKQRIKKPAFRQNAVKWDSIDKKIRSTLGSDDKEVVLITNGISGPATLSVIQQFKEHYPRVRHLVYEPDQNNAVLEANKKCFGKTVVPDYHFHRARVIVSINADFLGTWLNHVENTHRYVQSRDYDHNRRMSLHIQYESSLSLSGISADLRIPIKPSEEIRLLTSLYKLLAKRTGKEMSAHIQNIHSHFQLDYVADELLANKGRSILISGSREKNAQILINSINALLGNIGRCIDLDNPSYFFKHKTSDLSDIFSLHQKEKIGAILSVNNDFLRIHPRRNELQDIMDSIPLKISMNSIRTAFCNKADYLCPVPHFTESWDDFEPKKNHFLIRQGINKPITDTRPFQESLMRWIAVEAKWHDYLKDYWQMKILDSDTLSIEDEWRKLLRKGFYIKALTRMRRYENAADISALVNDPDLNKSPHETELVFASVRHYDSNTAAFNPWLAELPEAVSRSCYSLYAQVSPDFLKKHNLKEGNNIEIKNDRQKIRLTLIAVEGTHNDCVVIAAGKMTPYMAEAFNVNDLMAKDGKPLDNLQLSFSKTGRRKKLIKTQEKKEYRLDTKLSYNLDEYEHLYKIKRTEQKAPAFLSVSREFKGHHWAMVIDLNKCIACQSCVISCQMENNIPLVGQRELALQRQMYWKRLDHYHKNGDHFFIPVNCQQCDNAPCERVCPVAAVSSSTEGLSQQNYQRCIGARYCAVNCPYTVRRFNFDSYEMKTAEENGILTSQHYGVLLNPDVSLRERGVIEKCSFCIQRIMEAKSKAKKEGRALIDGDVKTACQQSCPAQAIYFGDMNDQGSEVFSLARSRRAFVLLENLSTKASVIYLSKIRNRKTRDV